MQSNKISCKAGNDIKHCVYTYYDKNNNPLYIGKSKIVYKRHITHKKDVWMKEAATIGLRFYKKREEMDIAEIYYVASLHPPFNIEYNKDHMSVHLKLIDYSEEERLTLNEFITKYGPHEIKNKQGCYINNTKKMTVEERIADYHKTMSRDYPGAILEVDSITTGCVSLIFISVLRIKKLAIGILEWDLLSSKMKARLNRHLQRQEQTSLKLGLKLRIAQKTLL